jgi:glutaredoxin 3
MHIKIYTKAYCTYCYAAKNLLMKRGLAFEETDLSGNFPAEQEMRDLTGRTTVPQILINGMPVGGYTDLIELDRAGKLDAFRTASGV